MSSTSKGPRAHASAPGEVGTNWTIVRIVVALAVLAGGCIGFNVWSSHARRARDDVAKPVAKKESPLAAPVKSRKLRREPVLFTRPGPLAAIEPERPPQRNPGPPLPPERAPLPPTDSLALATDSGAVTYGDGLAATTNPAATLVTLDEPALLRQLGFAAKSREELAYEMSGHKIVSADRILPLHVAEVDLESEKGTIAKLSKSAEQAIQSAERRVARRAEEAASKQEATSPISKKAPALPDWAKPGAAADAWLDLLAKRADLQGLPYRKGTACQLSGKATIALRDVSRKVGRAFGRIGEPDRAVFRSGYQLRATIEGTLNQAPFDLLAKRGDAAETDLAVPGVVQICQVGGAFDRHALVDFLEQIRAENSTAALAQRALFELAKPVRAAAVEALSQRSAAETRPRLLAGLRYPWAAVADHAAEALVAVRDRHSVSDLVNLLDEPDPTAPFVNRSGKWAVRELVRVNHLRNCLLCHVPSLSGDDPVRGLVPVVGQQLPRQYYHDSSGMFVRADITYLRQDFSLMHPVKDHAPWPEMQRFDYLVRTRELTKSEVTGKQLPSADRAAPQTQPDQQNYPQREAVIYALRRLTGLDGGRSARRWRELVAANPATTR